MEFIKVKGYRYDILQIESIQLNVIKIIFDNIKPSNFTGGFDLYTAGGSFSKKFAEYNTIYKEYDNVIELSNDGTVFQEPEKAFFFDGTSSVNDNNSFSLEELKNHKKELISAECQKKIYEGIDVELEGSIKHFSLTEHDQLNLFSKQLQIMNGAEIVEYHADNEPFYFYSAIEIQTVITAAQNHINKIMAICNNLFILINSLSTEDELNNICFNSDIPEDLQTEVYKKYNY